MTNSRIGRRYSNPELKNFPDSTILVEAAMRRGQAITELINPTMVSQIRIDLQQWKFAWLAAKNVWIPNRNPMYLVYDNIMIDNTLTSIIDTRILKAQQSKFNIVDKSNKANSELAKLFQKPWFEKFIEYAMRSKFEGYSLIEFFDFMPNGEINTIKLVDKYHVKADRGVVTKESFDVAGGTDYLSGPISQYYIPVGDKDDLGLLYKVAPMILAKKYAIGTWSEYNEKQGIPFRTVTTPINDTTRQQQLATIMENMGSAGWAVLNEGEKAEILLNNGNDPTKCFEGLINKMDSEGQMLILGQSSTGNSQNNKGTYGSMKILQEITNDRHEADLTFLKYLINDVLIPRMIQWGYKLEGWMFDWDKSVDLGIGEIIDYVTSLEGAGLEVDIQYITDKTTIPITGRKAVTSPPNAPPKKQNPSASADKKKSINAFYKDCCSVHGKHSLSVLQGSAADDKKFKDITLSIAKDLYKGKQSGIVNMDLLKLTATKLRDAITIGYATTDNKDIDITDLQMLSHLKNNAVVFAAFKSYQNQQEMISLLTDKDGKLRSFSDYKTEVLKTNTIFNTNYLNAEYNHAVVSSQMASRWQDFERNKETLPYLEFDATLDNRTTAICISLDGTRLPVDDEFWDNHALPLHWNERSVIRQIAYGPATDKNKINAPDLKPFFKNNPGKTGQVFPDGTYPYSDVNKTTSNKIIDAAKAIIDQGDPKAYHQVYKGYYGTVEVNETHNASEIEDNLRVAKFIADNNNDVKLLPYSYQKGIKNPDASINNKIADFKGVEALTHSAVQHAIEHASTQTAEIVVITLPKDITNRDVVRAMYAALSNPEWNRNIKSVWFIKNNILTKVERKEVVSRTFKGLP